MNRGEAEVLNMIWPTRFIQQYIPIRPADCTIVEVINHRMPVLLTQSPILQFLSVEGIRAAFSEEQVFIREGFMHEPDVIEHRLAAAPWLIPVIADPPDIPRSFRVSEDYLGSLVNEITVVVPGNDLLITQPFSFHRRTEMVGRASCRERV